jgi:pyruvate kinase
VIPHGHRFTLDRDPTPGDATRVQLPHPELFEVLEVGQRLLINDGKIRLRVTEAAPDRIVCTPKSAGSSPTARASTCPTPKCRSRR